MNKTEARYASHLQTRLLVGEIQWWKFGALTLKLAEDLRLIVDFYVLTADGYLEAHDTKGAKAIYQEDAKAKMKMAASMWPFRFFAVFPIKGGGWLLEEVKA